MTFYRGQVVRGITTTPLQVELLLIDCRAYCPQVVDFVAQSGPTLKVNFHGRVPSFHGCYSTTVEGRSEPPDGLLGSGLGNPSHRPGSRSTGSGEAWVRSLEEAGVLRSAQT